MRCPKCFGELDTGMNCYSCQNKGAISNSALSDGVINALTDKERSKMFLDLMCIIHRDGGHYMAENGEQKAYDDAIEKILPLIQEHL